MHASTTATDFCAKDVHELSIPQSELPVYLKVVDRSRGLVAKVKYGEQLILLRSYNATGYMVQPERGNNVLFIPSSYDGLFQSLPYQYPLVDDLRGAWPKRYVRVTKTWRSPYRCCDSVFLDDRVLVEKVDYVVIPEVGLGEQEVLVCSCQNPQTEETFQIRLPMEASCHFEEEPSDHLKILRIGDIKEFPTRVEVHARGSSSFSCANESLISPGRRLEICSMVSLKAVILRKAKSVVGSDVETFELLKGPHSLLVQPQATERTQDTVRLYPKFTRKVIHVLSLEQANTMPHVHPYAEPEFMEDVFDDTQLAFAACNVSPTNNPLQYEQPPPIPRKLPKASVKPTIRETSKSQFSYEVTEIVKQKEEDSKSDDSHEPLKQTSTKPVPAPRKNLKQQTVSLPQEEEEHFV